MGGPFTFEGNDQPSTGMPFLPSGSKFRGVANVASNGSEQKLFWLELNASFPVDKVIASAALQSVAAPENSAWNTSYTGLLFADADVTTLYNFGPEIDASGPPQELTLLPAFNISSSQWSNVTVAGPDFTFDNLDPQGFASSIDSGQGLNFLNSGNVVKGASIVKFDASDSSQLSWTNETGSNFPSTQSGTMQYVRAGKAGVLIGFGGFDTSAPGADSEGYPFDFRPMESILVYDIYSNTWYTVTATGTIPPPRDRFCSTVTASPDDSSFQVTMYGGMNHLLNQSLEDVNVLTIPSFRWFNVNTRNNAEAALSQSIGRDSHICQIYKDTEMIVLGGSVKYSSTSPPVNTNTCNDSYPAIRVLDTSTFTWLNEFTPNPENYSVPSFVYSAIGGNAFGSANVTEPEGGFNDSALGPIFSQRVPRFTPPNLFAQSTNISSPATNTSQPVSSGTSSSKSKSKSNIVGGVVGGVVALALLLVIGFYSHRAQKARQQKEQQAKRTSEAWAKAELEPTEAQYKMELHGNDFRPELPAKDQPVWEMSGESRPTEISDSLI
ncbi:MAG: hypothetical protein M1827_000511 [Pycnora praestabilis]|nr:MAG: hypothetical protein M1827_000511 [Pycnora praestabilis]